MRALYADSPPELWEPKIQDCKLMLIPSPPRADAVLPDNTFDGLGKALERAMAAAMGMRS